MPTITVTLTPEQARVVRDAVDLVERLYLGQLDELLHFYRDHLHRPGEVTGFRRLRIKELLETVKLEVFPELDGGPGHSYGVGSPQLPKDAKRLYEIYKVLDHALWLTHPEKDRQQWCRAADDPYMLNYSGDAKIPFEVKP